MVFAQTLNLALVGVGGRGEWFVGALPGMRTRFAALCDTHAYRLNRAGEKFPEAKRYRDFRRMLDETDASGILCSILNRRGAGGSVGRVLG